MWLDSVALHAGDSGDLLKLALPAFAFHILLVSRCG